MTTTYEHQRLLFAAGLESAQYAQSGSAGLKWYLDACDTDHAVMDRYGLYVTAYDALIGRYALPQDQLRERILNNAETQNSFILELIHNYSAGVGLDASKDSKLIEYAQNLSLDYMKMRGQPDHAINRQFRSILRGNRNGMGYPDLANDMLNKIEAEFPGATVERPFGVRRIWDALRLTR